MKPEFVDYSVIFLQRDKNDEGKMGVTIVCALLG